ncbi:MAG TPA: tRNA lysidine(34) synthetase TilS, partial [Verrucomicrobiae bacterium]|nr:tRNA lysidine(34) synthetase TilS [Verrucomicrobiae bacterium]
MTGLLPRIESSIQNRRLFARGQKILVAVSGGMDSMALLHALEKISASQKCKIVMAHFNHQLRGRASDADEKLVRQAAAELKLPVVVESADIKAFAKKSKLSVEMAARKLRHEFFARIAREQKIKIIALAHHADDQVELFFLRLLRGAGGEGLAGMKWRSPSPIAKGLSLVRPLLNLTKAELQVFARENKIHFRDDATNFSSDFLRNRIRNELLPLLRKKYQPGLNQTVLRLMEIVGAESEFVHRSSERQFAQNKRKGRRTSAATTKKFENLPVAIQRRILQSQLIKLNLPPDFDLIERLRQSPNQFVSVSRNLSVARKNSGEMELRTESKPEFNAKELAVNLAGRAGELIFGDKTIHWSLKKFAGSQGHSPHQKNREFFDADKIGGEIILRHWRAGDRFQPIGLKSPVKLQDLFVNAKIPAVRR